MYGGDYLMNKGKCIGVALLIVSSCIYSGDSKASLVVRSEATINNINNITNEKNVEQGGEKLLEIILNRSDKVTFSKLYRVIKVTNFDPTYRYVDPIRNSRSMFLVATSDEKKGIVNEKDQWLVEPIYQELFVDLNMYEMGGLIPAKKDDKWGYINLKGEVVIDFLYEKAGEFSEGLAAVKQGGKGGYINEEGKVVIPLKYNSVGIFYDGMAQVDRGILDKAGRVIVPFNKIAAPDVLDYGGHGWMGDGVIVIVDEKKKVSYINREGKVIADEDGEIRPLEALYEISSIDGKIKVSTYKEGGVEGEANSSCETYIDSDGVELYPRKYNEVDYCEEANLVIVGNMEGGTLKYGATDFSKEPHEVIPLVYDFPVRISEGYIVVKKDGKYGCLDYEGREVIPFIYDDMDWFRNGNAIACKGGYYGVINKQEEEVIPFKYRYIIRDTEPNFFNIMHGGKEGLVDYLGNVVVPPVNYDLYGNVRIEKEGIIEIERDGERAYVDYEGNYILPFGYKYLSDLGDDYYFAKVRDNFELIRLIKSSDAIH